MKNNPYALGLAKNPANFQPLTPLSFLARAAEVFPHHRAVVHGAHRSTYAQYYARTRRLASALSKLGVGVGDTVSVMLHNTPPMLEAHYGVPMTGAVLHSINTRLDAAIIGFMLDHAETKVIITDTEFSPVMREALAKASVKPIVIDYADPEYPGLGERLGERDYEAFVAGGDADFEWRMPDDEWDAIALNYTSGTTGNPKGVVYQMRAAMMIDDALGIAGGSRRIVQRDRVPFVVRRPPAKIGLAGSDERLVIAMAQPLRGVVRRGTERVDDVDDEWLDLHLRQGRANRGSELGIRDQDFRPAMDKHESNGVGVEARIERIEHATDHRDAEVHLDHLGRVREHGGDGIAGAHARSMQRRGKLEATLVGLAPGDPSRPVDDRHLFRPDGGGPLDERQRRQRRMVRRIAFKILLVGISHR